MSGASNEYTKSNIFLRSEKNISIVYLKQSILSRALCSIPGENLPFEHETDKNLGRLDHPSRKHTYIILTPLNPTFNIE